jgi:hypothetical protein
MRRYLSALLVGLFGALLGLMLVHLYVDHMLFHQIQQFILRANQPVSSAPVGEAK